MLRIYDQVDLRREAFALLSNVADGVSQSARAREVMARYPVQTPMYRPLADMLDRAEAAIQLSEEERLLFVRQEGLDAPIAGFFWIWDTLPVKERAALPAIGNFLDVPDEEAFASDAACADYIMRMPMPLQTRTRLLAVYGGRDAFAAAYRRAIRRASEVLEEPLEKFADRAAAFAAWLRREIDDCGGLPAMLQRLDIGLQLDSDDYEIHPSVVEYNGIWMMNNRIAWGIYIVELMQVRGEMSSERAMEVLRLLGDKTKFEIVRALGGGRMYGQALAEQLRLTPATISHHVSQLGGADLVRVEKQGNRVYYSVEKEKLRGMLEMVVEAVLAGE